MTDRDALIERYRHLVPLTRRRLIPTLPARIDRRDLDGAGALGLCRAAASYDPARATPFKDWAITHIRGAMQDWLRTDDWAPRWLREAHRRGEDAGISEPLSLETLLEGEQDQQCSRGWLGDPEDAAALAQARLEVWLLVRGLSERLRAVLLRRLLEEQEYAQIGRALRVSPGRARQLYEDAVRQVRAVSGATGSGGVTPRWARQLKQRGSERRAVRCPDAG